jgi:DNA-binding response OmpR family regulator
MREQEKNRKRILIVDDDLDLLMLLERRLKKENYEIETAASLPEAEEIIATFSPHLLLLDVNVNGEDGRQLCWRLKKSVIYKEVKVLMMSGYDYSIGRAALFGADNLLPKPLHTDILIHLVDEHLNPKPRNGVDPLLLIKIPKEVHKTVDH